MNNDIFYNPMYALILLLLVFALIGFLFLAIEDYSKKDTLKKENKILKRDLSYCKQFMCPEDKELYLLHRQFDIELEEFLDMERICSEDEWNK